MDISGNRRHVVKFGAVGSPGEPGADPYADCWSLQQTTGPERLVVAPKRGHHVDALLELSRCLAEPFGILYVLIVPRTGEHVAGRYQSPAPTDRKTTEAFLVRFREFFEGDGRHHIWLRSLPAQATLVYDNHDLIYAYGPVHEYCAALTRRGFTQGPTRIPLPHEHLYNAEFDASERDLLGYWEWKHFPLQPGDDP